MNGRAPRRFKAPSGALSRVFFRRIHDEAARSTIRFCLAEENGSHVMHARAPLRRRSRLGGSK